MKDLLTKRTIPFALSALSFALAFLSFEAPAAAQSSAGVGVSPLVVEATVQKGAAHVAKFLVANNLPSPMRVRASVKDVWHDGAGNRLEAEPGTQPRSASGWIRFNRAELVVAPMSTATVEAVISVPRDAAGSYYSMPVFELTRAASADAKGAGANFGFRFQGRIVVTTAEGSDFSLRIVGGKVSPPTPSTPLSLTLDLSNTGNAHIVPSVTFALLDETGRLVGRGKCPAKKLMPSEHAEASGTWAGVLPPGRYNVVSSVTYKTTSDPKTTVKEITFAVP